MKDLYRSDVYIIIRNFFFTVFLIAAIAILITATQYAGDKAHFQLTGEKYSTVSFHDLKNSCINFFSMIE